MTAKARGAISPPDVGRFWRRIALNIATLPEKVPCLVPLFRRTLLKDFEQEKRIGIVQPTQGAYGVATDKHQQHVPKGGT
jgi:hypothetical protein